MKILLVEDYDDTREFMKLHLEALGHEVFEAVTGVEAVKKAESCLPDLILMDLNLPELDGLTATRIIRESKQISKIPIIAVTAFGESAFERVMLAGCDSILSKPISFESLKAVLELHLKP